jgi:hypothetical protein
MDQKVSSPLRTGYGSLKVALPPPEIGRASIRNELTPETIAGDSLKVAVSPPGTNPTRTEPRD